VSARIWKAVKSLGVPKPVGSSQSRRQRRRLGERVLLELGVEPCLGHQMRGGRWADLLGEFGIRRWSSAVKMPFSMHNSRSAISKTSKSVISSTIGATVRSWS
jgi:hypothetical protein